MLNLPDDNGRRYERRGLEAFERQLAGLMCGYVSSLLRGVYHWCSATGRRPEAMLFDAAKMTGLRPALEELLPHCDEDALTPIVDHFARHLVASEAPGFEAARQQINDFMSQFKTADELCAACWADDDDGPDPSLN